MDFSSERDTVLLASFEFDSVADDDHDDVRSVLAL